MCDCNGASKKLCLIPAILDFRTVTLCESEDTALRRGGGKDRSTWISFLNTIYFCTESFPEFILSSAFPEVISCPSPFLDVKHLVFLLPQAYGFWCVLEANSFECLWKQRSTWGRQLEELLLWFIFASSAGLCMELGEKRTLEVKGLAGYPCLLSPDQPKLQLLPTPNPDFRHHSTFPWNL